LASATLDEGVVLMLTRRHALVGTALALALGSAAVTTAAPASATTRGYPAVFLDTQQEGGVPDTGAFGLFSYRIRGDQLCYTLIVRNLTTPAEAGHIHLGAAGVKGPVVIPLEVKRARTFTEVTCVTPSTPGILDKLAANPSGFYVNVHDATYPGGEIRGQLR